MYPCLPILLEIFSFFLGLWDLCVTSRFRASRRMIVEPKVSSYTYTTHTSNTIHNTQYTIRPATGTSAPVPIPKSKRFHGHSFRHKPYNKKRKGRYQQINTNSHAPMLIIQSNPSEATIPNTQRTITNQISQHTNHKPQIRLGRQTDRSDRQIDRLTAYTP